MGHIGSIRTDHKIRHKECKTPTDARERWLRAEPGTGGLGSAAFILRCTFQEGWSLMVGRFNACVAIPGISAELILLLF